MDAAVALLQQRAAVDRDAEIADALMPSWAQNLDGSHVGLERLFRGRTGG
jgi:hypothetical protein